MSEIPPAGQRRDSANELPPVVVPTAGFILQLFVIPGVIVVVIVMVWLMFSWLARAKTDPASYIAELKRPSEARWQVANNLVDNLLKDKTLTENEKFAADLASILDDEITAGQKSDNSIRFRAFLCRALGVFKTPQGLPVLRRAITTHRDDKENDVRLAALGAVAMLIDNLRHAGRLDAIDTAELEADLLKASEDENQLIRSSAAFPLGILGGDACQARLKVLLADPYPDARYNAATGLSRLGDPAAIEVLMEMLDPENRVGVELEQQKEDRELKRAVLESNALRAAAELARVNPQADLAPLVTVIEKLLASDANQQVKILAEETLGGIKKK